MHGRLIQRVARPRGIAPGVVLAAALLTLPGCLQRRIRVITDPPGATVWLNDAEVGTSPTETAFTFFGEYDVRIVKEGYQTLSTTRKASPPWYEYPFIDLIVVALPFNVETNIEWMLKLEPLAPADAAAESELLRRANDLRQQFGVVPPAAEEEPEEP